MRMQRTWLNFATGQLGADWPRYETEHRRTRVIRSTRDDTVADPDGVRRSAWEGLY
jgi:para-nitrobenzyl esterase